MLEDWCEEKVAALTFSPVLSSGCTDIVDVQRCDAAQMDN